MEMDGNWMDMDGNWMETDENGWKWWKWMEVASPNLNANVNKNWATVISWRWLIIGEILCSRQIMCLNIQNHFWKSAGNKIRSSSYILFPILYHIMPGLTSPQKNAPISLYCWVHLPDHKCYSVLPRILALALWVPSGFSVPAHSDAADKWGHFGIFRRRC